ncbi:MAG: hypothetical protein OXD49_11715 [Candidatus Poribacteria bacterium]|nr:hypothetical protein [Candidatus Poribacteria bacterium]
MIIQSHRKPDLLLADMTFWTMTINQPATEIYKNYKVLCPTILFAEIYNHVKGANKRLKNPFEVFYIEPWQILVKNELEGQPIIQSDNIDLVNLKSEQDMGEEERENVEFAKKLVGFFDDADRFLSAQIPTLKGFRENALVGFANAPYQDLRWDQFMERFKTVSKGTFFENVFSIFEMFKTDKNIARTAIEKVLSKYKEMYPINNFKKAFAFSKSMLENDFAGICDRAFIPRLEGPSGFDRTHWDNTRNNLTDSRIRDSFPYTWYALYHYLAFYIYQNENAYNKKIGARDFEYLYYLYFPNILFVSADAQHEKYITGAGILKSRRNSSFAYIPSDRDQAPEEHDKVMKYIKDGVLY